MHLIDIGANLTHESFAEDFEEVVERAVAAGLAHIMLTGTDLETSRAALDLARQRPGLFSSTVGLHPHVAAEADDATLEQLASLVAADEVVAIGETGLDYFRNFSPKEDQLRVFEALLELAVSSGKPLFLHQREAHEDFLPLLRRFRERIAGGVVHCFTDSRQALEDYLELDMYIGITGWICDERRGQDLQDSVQLIPDDRLLIETDAPYLLPRTLRPKPKSRRNEPAWLTAVLEKVADCRQQSVEELAELTTRNAVALFGLAGWRLVDGLAVNESA